MNIIIAFLLLLAYTAGLCVWNHKIPDSLSKTVFFLPRRNSWVWTLTIFLVVIFMLSPFGLPFGRSIAEKTDGWSAALLFISYFSLAVVGVTPLSNGDKDSIDYRVHMFAAWLCAIAINVVFVLTYPWILLGWLPWIAAFIWITKNEKWRTAKFWAEMSCFGMAFIYSLV